MGRLIDCNDVYNAIQITTDNFGVAKRVVEDNMLTMLSKIETVEAIPKAEYENRLKADMVAMLEKLTLEIEELDSRAGYDGGGMPTFSTDYIRKKKVNELVQQKIDKLKEKEMEIYGIEHRKKVAEKYNLDAQEIIDLPREKFEIFVSGLEIGEKYGAEKVIAAIKADMEAKDEQKIHTT